MDRAATGRDRRAIVSYQGARKCLHMSATVIEKLSNFMQPLCTSERIFSWPLWRDYVGQRTTR